jgi:hypothetical protein
MRRIFLFSELGERSPAKAALQRLDGQLHTRLLRGTYLDCPIALPPELMVVEPAPLAPVEGLAPAIAKHPVVSRVPWLLILDAEQLHLAPQLTCADFAVRGFSAAELCARAERLTQARPKREALLRSGPLHLDLAARTVKIGEQPLQLAPQEFALLRYLIQHPGRALSRDQLLNAVWGPLYQGGARTVDIHVRRLRAQLGDSARQLATVRGLGYRWSS